MNLSKRDAAKNQIAKPAIALVQSLVVNLCARYGAVDCIAPHMSVMAVGSVIKAVLGLIESLLFGSLAYCFYACTDPSHV